MICYFHCCCTLAFSLVIVSFSLYLHQVSILPLSIHRFDLYSLTSSSSIFCFNFHYSSPSFLKMLADSQNCFYITDSCRIFSAFEVLVCSKRIFICVSIHIVSLEHILFLLRLNYFVSRDSYLLKMY